VVGRLELQAATTSPDVGRTAGPGDTCVVFDGVYDVGGTPLVVTVENLIVRSMNGATATIIQGNFNGALINIVVRGVTFGGPAADQGFTVTNINTNGGIGLCVTQNTTPAPPPVTTPAPCNANVAGVITPAGAGIAQENITIQNNRFLGNGEEGVVFFYQNHDSDRHHPHLGEHLPPERWERLGLREHRWGHRPPRPGPQRGH
jgi:hypothetical protein